MIYPSRREVAHADLLQLCEWRRFLPSPGMSAVGTPDFARVMGEEAEVMRRILERCDTLGGVTPAVSKWVGWDPR